jgi:hypothetical protein
MSAGGFFREDLLATGRLQGIELHFGVLVLGRNSGVSDQHDFFSQNSSEG